MSFNDLSLIFDDFISFGFEIVLEDFSLSSGLEGFVLFVVESSSAFCLLESGGLMSSEEDRKGSSSVPVTLT